MLEYKDFVKQNPRYRKVRIGKGAFAECYKIGDDVYKKFFVPIYSFEHLYKNIIKLSSLKFENIVFPRTLIVDDISEAKLIYGYTMPYVCEDTKSLSLDNVIVSLQILESEVERLSKKYHIVLEDINPKNVIINHYKISLIDTDLYGFDEEDEELEKTNKSIFNYGLFQTLTRMSLYKLELDKKMNEILSAVIEGEIFLSEFMDEYILYLKEESDEDVRQIQDLRKISLHL